MGRIGYPQGERASCLGVVLLGEGCRAYVAKAKSMISWNCKCNQILRIVMRIVAMAHVFPNWVIFDAVLDAVGAVLC